MKIEVKQNTKEWRAWRDKGLGASDAPIVMGDSPWTTRFQLWAQKAGLMERPEPNAFQVTAMQRGHELEPKARELYEKQLGHKILPTSFEHDQYKFLRASLDGYNEEQQLNVEIKCPGKIDHATAVDGKVPDKYFPQVQAQMLVSGAALTHYFSWDGKDSHIMIVMYPDPAYQQKLLKEMIAFWNLVQNKQPPAFEEGEVEKMLLDVQKKLTQLQNTVKLLSSIETDGFVNVSKGG